MWKLNRPNNLNSFVDKLCQPQQMKILTHNNDIGHPSKGCLLNLGNLVLVNAKLLEAFGYVGRNLLQKILRQVESFQVYKR